MGLERSIQSRLSLERQIYATASEIAELQTRRISPEAGRSEKIQNEYSTTLGQLAAKMATLQGQQTRNYPLSGDTTYGE